MVLETLRRAMAFLPPNRRGRWLAVILLAALESGMEAVAALLLFALLSLLTANSTDVTVPGVGNLHTLFPHSSEAHVVLIVAFVTGVFFGVKAFVALVLSYTKNRTAYRTGVDLSTRLFRAYDRMPYEGYLMRNSAEMIRNAHDSVNAVVTFVFLPIFQLFSESLVIIAMALVLLVTEPDVSAAVIVLLTALVVTMLKVVQPRFAAIGLENNEASNQSYRALNQSFQGFRDMLLLGRQRYFERLFLVSKQRAARAQTTREFLLDVPRIVLEAVTIVSLVVGISFVVKDGRSTSHALAVIALFAYAALRVTPSLNRIATATNGLKFGRAAVDSISKDLAELPAISDDVETEGVVPLPLENEIALTNVNFRYPGAQRDAISNVDMRIRAGEFVGFVGATGAGKTTLLDIVLGLLRPTTGSVTVDAVDISEHLREWHRSLGTVPQTVFLTDDTLRNNIAFGNDEHEIDESRLMEAVSLSQLDSTVAGLPEGLNTFVGERGIRLSGGQRQRVAIARALYLQPKMLVFDEGTSALDNLTEAELMRELQLLRGERTILVIAHRLTTVVGCDRIVLLEDGRIVDVGTYDYLIAHSSQFREMTLQRPDPQDPGEATSCAPIR